MTPIKKISFNLLGNITIVWLHDKDGVNRSVESNLYLNGVWSGVKPVCDLNTASPGETNPQVTVNDAQDAFVIWREASSINGEVGPLSLYASQLGERGWETKVLIEDLTDSISYEYQLFLDEDGNATV